MLERTVVAKLERQGHIIKWLRYVDDCICVAKKGSFNIIFDKINKWDKRVKFSYEKMDGGELTFLASCIFLEGNSFQFRTSRKNGQETILTNYKKATVSKKYLIRKIYTM